MTEEIRIPNIQNYTQQYIDGELVLTPIYQYITEDELNETNILYSKIVTCEITNKLDIIYIISKNTNYRAILIDIWKTLPSQSILQTTTYNFKLSNENGEKGYNWCNEINMSFQDKNALGALREIINICKINNLSINLSIKLPTNKIVFLKTK
jgi:hypothetical protein